jgi:hypothetical protein
MTSSSNLINHDELRSDFAWPHSHGDPGRFRCDDIDYVIEACNLIVLQGTRIFIAGDRCSLSEIQEM